jgi:hypothetical protein
LGEPGGYTDAGVDADAASVKITRHLDYLAGIDYRDVEIAR